MTINSKINLVFVSLIALTLVLGCSGGKAQLDEANKIVDEANKRLEETKLLFSKVEIRNSSLFGAEIRTVGQFVNYRAKMGNEAKAIVADYEKVVENMKGIGKSYDDVSRLNVNEKYKEYAKIKSNEYYKRADAIEIRKGNAQAFAEIDDPRVLRAKFDENNTKSDKMFKDADDLAGQAKKIEEANKEIFRS